MLMLLWRAKMVIWLLQFCACLVETREKGSGTLSSADRGQRLLAAADAAAANCFSEQLCASFQRHRSLLLMTSNRRFKRLTRLSCLCECAGVACAGLILSAAQRRPTVTGVNDSTDLHTSKARWF